MWRGYAASHIHRVCKISGIKPVTAPLLSEARRCKQPVNESRKCALRRILREGLHLVRFRRKPHKSEKSPANQREGDSSGGGQKLGPQKPCQNKPVDRRLRPP